MIDRRSFLRTAILGGAAFGVGLKLGDGLGRDAGQAGGPNVILHGFLPDDQTLVREALDVFLSIDGGRLPTPALDAAPAWHATASGALRRGAERYVREARRSFLVQVRGLDENLPADLMLQQGGRVLDPNGDFGAGLLRLRERIHGRRAGVLLSCRIEGRTKAAGGQRVLVVETESGVQDRICLDGRPRRFDLHGPAGRTSVTVDERGAMISSASCRHATCRRQGVIARPGELIACAPNRLVLRIETA